MRKFFKDSLAAASKAVSKASIQTNQKFANAYGPVIIPNVAALHQTIHCLNRHHGEVARASTSQSVDLGFIRLVE